MSWLQSIRRAWRDFIGGLRGYDVSVCPWCKGEVHMMDNRDENVQDVSAGHVSPECDDWRKMRLSGDVSQYVRDALARGEI